MKYELNPKHNNHFTLAKGTAEEHTVLKESLMTLGSAQQVLGNITGVSTAGKNV